MRYAGGLGAEAGGVDGALEGSCSPCDWSAGSAAGAASSVWCAAVVASLGVVVAPESEAEWPSVMSVHKAPGEAGTVSPVGGSGEPDERYPGDPAFGTVA